MIPFVVVLVRIALGISVVLGLAGIDDVAAKRPEVAALFHHDTDFLGN